MESTKYCAFISYRHQSPDQEIAKALHTAIENYGIPASVKKKNGIRKMGKVFRDQEELPLSSNLGADIETALDNSDWFIAICSPRYLKSQWCLREMEYFIEHKGRDRVLTVLVEGEPETSFPEMLRFTPGEQEGAKEIEPLAADVRAESLHGMRKKLTQEKLRILAPMLGLRYDDLKQRARQRRRKQIAAAAAAFLALAGVLTGILLRNAALRQEALLQQQAAEEQQRIAEEERLKAAEEQRKAEEERKRAEEEERKAEEERQRAEAERLNAISNSIGESLQKAISLREDEDRRQSAGLLLDALALSEQNENMRREEIIDQLRRTMYIEPFSVVSHLDLQNTRLTNAQVSPDGTKVICIANGNSVALIDMSTSALVYAVSKSNEEIDRIAFSPDGSRFLALYDYYHYATIWNTEDGAEVFTYTPEKDEQGMVANALFWKGSDTLLVQEQEQFFLVSLPDGEKKLFYTIGEQQDGYDYGNNLYTFKAGKSLDAFITDHADYYTGCPVIISRDGTRIMIAGLFGETGTIILDDQGQRVSLLDRMPGMVVDHYDMSPDGTLVSCQSMLLGFMGTWETETGRLRYMKSLDRQVSNGTTAPVFSPDSQKLAFISENTLVIADALKGKELVRLDIEWQDPVPPVLSWSRDSQFLFFFTPNLYFVDAETGGIIVFRTSDVDNMFNNAVSTGDDLVFVTRGGGEASLYSLPGISSVVFTEESPGDLTGYDPLKNPEEPWETEPEGEHRLTETFKAINSITDTAPAVFFSREGNYAALVYADGTIEVFRKGENRKVFLKNAQFTYAPVAFGIIADTMVASDRGGRLLFQNLADGSMTILKTGVVHTDFIFSGNLLMARRESHGIIDVYNAEKAELLFSMRSSVPFTQFGFSGDGKSAVGITADLDIMVADLLQDESALLERARRFAPGH